MVTIVQVSVRLGKTYLPVLAETDTGMFIPVDPVYTADLTVEGLSAALDKVMAAGHPQIPHPSQEEWRRIVRKNPLLLSARVKNWKEFSQGSVGYIVEWKEQTVELRVYRIDRQGWSIGPLKTLSFPADVSSRTIAEAILEDVRLRPELQAERSEPGQTEGQAQE